MKGYTLSELLICFVGLVVIALTGVFMFKMYQLICAGIHFLNK